VNRTRPAAEDPPKVRGEHIWACAEAGRQANGSNALG